MAAPVWTGGAGGTPVFVCAGTDEPRAADVDNVYRTDEPAAVGRVVCVIDSVEEKVGLTVGEAAEEESIVLRGGTLLTS